MTTPPRALRPYQIEAHDAVIGHWAANTRRTAVVLPTGAGKSTVIGKIAHTALAQGMRPLLLAHRGELIDQLVENTAAVDPSARPVGVVRAARNEVSSPIVAATLQTLASGSRLEALRDRNVILLDECHHGSADTYLRALQNLGVGQEAFFCGFTATLRRDDGKALREIIDTVAYEKDLRWAIESGYLVKPRGLTVKIPELDLTRVKVTAGDFQNNELAEVMEASTESVVDAVVKFAGERRPIIFAASVLAAQLIADALEARGITAGYVTGAMTLEQRQPVYRGFRDGSIQAMVTVQVLTEGADFPMCDTAVIARPTQSQILYSQMVGRALRLSPGKEDALVLDLSGTSRVLKLVTLTDLDAGTDSKNVDPDGNELEPDEDDEVPLPAPTERQKRLGPVDMVSIDLLGSDSTGVLWMATRGGVPFMPVQDLDAAIFLWPLPGDVYRPGTMSMHGRKSGDWIDERAWPLEIARDIAEDWVIEQGHSYPRRNQSWRRYQAPSEAQLRYARSLGIPDSEGMTRARLSDEISVKLASDRLDSALT